MAAGKRGGEKRRISALKRILPPSLACKLNYFQLGRQCVRWKMDLNIALKKCVRTFCMPPTLVRTAPLRKGTAKCEWCRHHPSLISSGLDLQNFVDIFHPCSQLSVRHCLVILGSTSGSHRPLTWQSIFGLLRCNLSRGPIQHQ